MTKSELRTIKCIQGIEDPFPEHTKYNILQESLGLISKLMGKIHKSIIEEPKKVNIWEAYKLGYDKAFEIIEFFCTEDYLKSFDCSWIEDNKKE